MALKVGTRLKTSASSAELIVVRGTDAEGAITCAGAELSGDAESGADSGSGPALAIGKRFVDEESGIELLVVKPGSGPVEFAGRELTAKVAKPLPASD